MSILGYIGVLASIYFLYTNELVFGVILFVVGGFLSGGLHVSIKSGGILLMVMSGSYGFHNGFTPTVFFLMFIGFVMFSFTKSRQSGEWDFDFDFSDFGSGGDSGGFGGDGGGSDGGGGGD